MLVLAIAGAWLLLCLGALAVAVGAVRAGHAEDLASGYADEDLLLAAEWVTVRDRTVPHG